MAFNLSAEIEEMTTAPSIPKTAFNLTFDAPSANIQTLAIVVRMLGKYYVPALIILGMIGNILSLLVFLITYLSRLSLSVYLTALAISDLGFLTALGLIWLEYIGHPLFHSTGWCQLTVYTGYVTSFLSVWYVVSFTVERYIAICHALHRPEMCTTSRARYVVCGLTALGLVAYSVSVWTSGVEEISPGYSICVPSKRYYHIHKVVTYVDTLVTLLIPFTAILVLNIRITYHIAYFYAKHKFTAIKVRFRGSREGHTKINLGLKAQVKVTKMLLVISSVFLLVNSPSYIIRMRLFVGKFTKSSQQSTIYEALIQQLSQYLFYLNFSINFLLYNMCCKKFRAALSRLFWQVRYKVMISCQVSSRKLRSIYQTRGQPDS